jgi:hypothetical protein
MNEPTKRTLGYRIKSGAYYGVPASHGGVAWVTAKPRPLSKADAFALHALWCQTAASDAQGHLVKVTTKTQAYSQPREDLTRLGLCLVISIFND